MAAIYLEQAKEFLGLTPAALEFAPSIDRPFGFDLWVIFCDLIDKSPITFDPRNFVFTQNSDNAWLTTWNEVIAAVVTYYVVIFGGNFVMKSLGMKPIKLNFVFRLHNLLLTGASLLLLVLLSEQLIPILYHHGLLYAICNTGSWTQPIQCLYYLNYLCKYYEFVDTVFLVLRRKPLTFLHTYHHGCTALLCYTQLIGYTSVSWVPITLNLFVHVIMYWYYFLSSCGIRVWWKEWVTRTQIIQFVIDLFFVYFASYTYFTSTYWPHMPNMGNCAGEEFAAIYGCALLTSYLVLFIAFYIKVYVDKKSKRSEGSASEKATSKSSSKSTKTPRKSTTKATSKSADQPEKRRSTRTRATASASVTPSERVTRSRKA